MRSGGADQVKLLAKAALEKTLVGVRDMFQRISVDHDHRRIHATLVRITQLGAEHAGALGALELHGLEQQPGEHRRGHLAIGRLVRLRDRTPQRAQPLPFGGRDQVHRGKFQERQGGSRSSA
jgi:hypothetical protein